MNKNEMSILCKLVLLVCVAIPTALAEDQPTTNDHSSSLRRYHHGAEIADPYHWLEDKDSDSVQQWVNTENRLARQYIRSLPQVSKIRIELRKLKRSRSPLFREIQFRNGVLCALRYGSLVVLESPENPKPSRYLVDANNFIPEHEADIDFYELSPDGQLVAVCISLDRTEDGNVYIFRTSDGHRVDQVIPGVSGPPGGDLAWAHDGSGFYYTKYPFAESTDVPDRWRYSCEEIWFHQLGHPPDQDTYVAGDSFQRFPQCLIETSPHSDKLVINFGSGGGAAGQNYLLVADGRIESLVKSDASVAAIQFASAETLLMESCQDAPCGKILRCRIENGQLSSAEQFLSEQSSVLYAWSVGDEHFYATHFSSEGREVLSVVDMKSADVVSTVELPPFSAITEMCVLEEDRLLYRTESFLQAVKWSIFDPKTKQSHETALSAKSEVDFSDIRATREWATSADGTKVPITILHPAECKRDGSHPTLVSVYGGSKIRETPVFDEERRVWFDHGGIYVFVHPRGEYELGEDWYRATLQGQKQVTRDDTIAALEHLIQRKYTNPGRLALTGASHGGLIVGMVMTRRPDLMAAVIAFGGDFCVLQNEDSLLGPHLMLEYGNSADGVEFERMIEYSPYQQIREGVDYPAVWLRASFLDRRVMPWNSWKMAARLQSADSNGQILVTTEMGRGHSDYVRPEEELAFLLSALKVPPLGAD